MEYDAQDDALDPRRAGALARLLTMRPPQLGPSVLIGEQLARARPAGIAARVEWLWPGVKKRKLEVLSSFYRESVHRSVIEALDALIPAMDDPSPESVSAAAGAFEAMRCETALASALRASLLHVFGRGPEPDLAWVAAETWADRETVGSIARLAAEASSDGSAGAAQGGFTIDEGITGALADALNCLLADGLLPSWRTMHRARVEQAELLALVPERSASAAAARARAL